MVLGLTGKACCGKNIVASMFEEKGWKVVDVDKLGHPVLEESQDELRKTFGDEVVKDGTVDRKALGKIVFSDAEKLRQLEAITHPRMVAACKSIIQQATEKVVVLNAALLHRMDLDQLCDRILFVKSPYLVRYHRAQERDGYDWKRFRNRENSQKDITEHNICRGKTVDVLDNREDVPSLHRQVDRYCDTLRENKG